MKLIQVQGNAALVEWRDEDNNIRRSIVPSDRAMQGTLSEQDAAEGIPFGANWETMLDNALATRLANRLREQGIWTYSDASSRIRDFRQVVNEIVVASLLDAARGVRKT